MWKIVLLSYFAQTFAKSTYKLYKVRGQECVTKDGDYYGKIAETKNGKGCKKWSSINPPLKPVDYFEADHNYCRYVNISYGTMSNLLVHAMIAIRIAILP